jgi:hypothetical protein
MTDFTTSGTDVASVADSRRESSAEPSSHSEDGADSESSTNSRDFDNEAFLEWLDDQEGAVPQPVIVREWPDFPWKRVGAVTCSLTDDGEVAYYQRDLRRAARGRRPLD